MKKVILFVVITLLGYATNAQGHAKKAAVGFQAVASVGLLNGSNGAAGAIQAVVGATYRGTYLGAGAGLDYYRFRSVPVFAHLAQQFGKGPRNFLLYGDLGYHYDWLTEKNRNQYFNWTNADYRGGIYYEAGIGYTIELKDRDALILSAGYSYKKMTRLVRNDFCPFAGPCTGNTDTYGFSMPRLMVKAGWRF